jgi:hypothetical protein
LFKGLDILPLQAHYILSVSMFVIVNNELFTINSQGHNCNTRIIRDLHYPRTTMAQFQKGMGCTAAKVFNHLPTEIKPVSND